MSRCALWLLRLLMVALTLLLMFMNRLLVLMTICWTKAAVTVTSQFTNVSVCLTTF